MKQAKYRGGQVVWFIQERSAYPDEYICPHCKQEVDGKCVVTRQAVRGKISQSYYSQTLWKYEVENGGHTYCENEIFPTKAAAQKQIERRGK